MTLAGSPLFWTGAVVSLLNALCVSEHLSAAQALAQTVGQRAGRRQDHTAHRSAPRPLPWPRQGEEETRHVNQYGAIARQHWKRWRPVSYAAITDPAVYFTDLGEQAAAEITRLWAQLRAQEGNPPGEDYLHRVARLNALRKQAEENRARRPDPVATRTRCHRV